MSCQGAYSHEQDVRRYAEMYPDLGAPERAKERRRVRRDKRRFWIVRIIVWSLVLGGAYAMGYSHAHKEPARAVPAAQSMPDKGMNYTPSPQCFHKGNFT